MQRTNISSLPYNLPRSASRPTGSISSPDQQPQKPVLRIRPRLKRSHNLLLDLSIGGRLTLGFLLAGLIAALVAGTIGFLRAQSLSRQSDFYQHLLQVNTRLTTGVNYLQLMNSEAQNILDAATAPTISQETLNTDRQALQTLVSRYDSLLSASIASDLLDQHPDQVALLAEANHGTQITQQRTLVSSAQRTWQIQRTAQQQFLQDIANGNLQEAQRLRRVQGEPTNADALSALRALIQFNQRLAGFVSEAARIEEQSQFFATIIGSVLAFIFIIIVGWLISRTLVKRLKHLRRVVRAVEQGQVEARANVIGRDEIAEVAAAVNAMLEAILGLLQEAQQQRDALARAADHLFTDIRGVGAGDLRINAAVRDDPLGLLANTFNLTVGRFRRFVLRTQHAVEQIDVITRQEIEHAENFESSLAHQTLDDTSSVPLSGSALVQEINQLENQLTYIVAELRTMRPKTFSEMADLNAAVHSLVLSLHALKLKASSSGPLPGKEQPPELTRIAQDFVNEITSSSLKLTKLVHEMRQNLIIYQLDADNPGSIPTASSYQSQYRPSANTQPETPIDSPRRRNALARQL